MTALPHGGAAAFDIPETTYPALPQRAETVEGFVPRGWVLETLRRGDLNGDGVPDAALVLRENNPRNVLANKDGLGRDPFDTNPRILAAVFGEQGGFRLQLANHTLIPRPESPTLDDVLSENGGVSIERGTLRVRLHVFASAGSWGMSLSAFTFRFQNGRFELIGFDRDETQRNTGQTVTISVNYSTGRMSRTLGSIENDRVRTMWSTLARRAPLSIEDVGDGLEFDPRR